MALSHATHALLLCVAVIASIAATTSPTLAADGDTASQPPSQPPIDMAAAAASGLLRAKATVEGAQVYVDNEILGATPIVSYLPPGKHTVRIVADNYDPFVRQVTIIAGRTVDVSADLIAGDGTVEFVADPSGATLTLNKQDDYPTPVRLRGLDPGDYQWTLVAPGHEAAAGSFSFAKGENLLILQTLESSAGRFTVRSRPDGADVYLDGQHLGVTPLDLRDVEPGLHQVLLDMKGHASVIRTVDTSDGSKGEVSARVPKKGASLAVKTPSSDAVVRLNGLKIGTGRKVKLPELERGRYTLQVSAPGRQTAQARIEIPGRGAAAWRAHLREGESDLVEFTPLSQSWAFWAGTAAVAAGAAAAGIVAYNATVPDPTPDGDILVTLP